MNYAEAFVAARSVATPLVNIRTFDPASTRNGIKKLLLDDPKTDFDKTPILQWDVMNGVRAANPAGQTMLSAFITQMKLKTLDGTGNIDEMLRLSAKFGDLENNLGEDIILYIDNAHLYWGTPNSAAVVQGIWNLRDIFKRKGNMLVLLTSPGATVPTELVNDILILDEPLPTEAELTAIVNNVFKYAKFATPDATIIRRATDALIGLPAFPADQSAAMCLVRDDDKHGHLDVDSLWGRKRAVINQTPGLSVWEGDDRLEDIGGLDAIKAYLKAVMEGNNIPRAIVFMDEIEKGFAGWGTDTSGATTKQGGSFLTWTANRNVRGILGTGVPGAGKSQIVKAIGKKYGIPVILLSIADMQNSLVGSSEARTQQAFAIIDAISSGNFIIIATSNSVEALPPELLRRFQTKFFFEEPSEQERKAIWPIYRERYHIDPKDTVPTDIGWTGAEIKDCCEKAYDLKLTLQQASRYIVPTTVSSRDVIEKLKVASSGRYLSASTPGFYLGDLTLTSVGEDLIDAGRKMR
jgi:hypothetical protein